MSEMLRKNGEIKSKKPLYDRLYEIRLRAWEKEDVNPRIAITKDVELPGVIPVKALISAIESDNDSDGYIVIRYGDDLRDPEMHDYIVARIDGAVYRYDPKERMHHELSADDYEVLDLIVGELEQPYMEKAV